MSIIANDLPIAYMPEAVASPCPECGGVMKMQGSGWADCLECSASIEPEFLRRLYSMPDSKNQIVIRIDDPSYQVTADGVFSDSQGYHWIP